MQFTSSDIWKQHAVLVDRSANTKISLCSGVNLRTDSYLYWWKPSTQSTSWCLSWSLAIVMLCHYSSSHMASHSIQSLEGGSAALDWESGCWRTLHWIIKLCAMPKKLSLSLSLSLSCWAWWLQCLPMVWETKVQSQLESYLRLKNGTWCFLAKHLEL